MRVIAMRNTPANKIAEMATKQLITCDMSHELKLNAELLSFQDGETCAKE